MSKTNIIFTAGLMSLVVAIAGHVLPKAIAQTAHDSVHHNVEDY